MKSLLLSTIFLSVLSNANEIEQQKYLEDFCDKVNCSIERLKDFPRKKTHIKEISFDNNFTINLSFKSHLKNNITSTIKEDFEAMNKSLMKRKFCRFDYFERMKEGLVINFNYYNQKEELITGFYLNYENCKEANSALSKLKYNE